MGRLGRRHGRGKGSIRRETLCAGVVISTESQFGVRRSPRSIGVMREAEELIVRCRSLSIRVGTFIRRTVAENDAFAQDLTSLMRQLDDVERRATATNDTEALRQAKNARDILHGNGPGGDLRKLCQKRNPWLLRFLLGEKCMVLTLRDDSGLALKEEYHVFRSKAAWFMALAPTFLLYGLHRADQSPSLSFRPLIMSGIQVFLAWLCYCYIALALRENVLYVNGSNIRSWWITHHYLSMLTCLLMLSLPVDSPAFTMFCGKLLRWSAFQGIVMLVQNRYQKRRMYTRIALGKNSAMDVVTGESSGMQGQLLLLYPMLFLLQFWQIVIGSEVAVTMAPAFASAEDWLDPGDRELDLKGRRGVFVAGVLFCWMGLLNFFHTVVTILDKSATKRKKV